MTEVEQVPEGRFKYIADKFVGGYSEPVKMLPQYFEEYKKGTTRWKKDKI